MKIQFFMTMIPPTITHQEKKVRVVDGKPVFYEPQELKTAREKIAAHLSHYVPERMIDEPVRLVTKWCFPKGRHSDGEYKGTRPDTDNLQKMLKDVMTQVGFWRDDALVASEITEKFWAKQSGIFISVEEL